MEEPAGGRKLQGGKVFGKSYPNKNKVDEHPEGPDKNCRDGRQSDLSKAADGEMMTNPADESLLDLTCSPAVVAVDLSRRLVL